MNCEWQNRKVFGSGAIDPYGTVTKADCCALCVVFALPLVFWFECACLFVVRSCVFLVLLGLHVRGRAIAVVWGWPHCVVALFGISGHSWCFFARPIKWTSAHASTSRISGCRLEVRNTSLASKRSAWGPRPQQHAWRVFLCVRFHQLLFVGEAILVHQGKRFYRLFLQSGSPVVMFCSCSRFLVSCTTNQAIFPPHRPRYWHAFA